MMNYNNQICPKCKKQVTILWKQHCGIRVFKEIEGEYFYFAKCSTCDHEWIVKK